jgi:hypothetical protein
VFLSGNQALDPAGIASYCSYQNPGKSYGLVGKKLARERILIPQGRQVHNSFKEFAGFDRPHRFANQGLGCGQKPNG